MNKFVKLIKYIIELLKYIILYPIAIILYSNKSIYIISERGYDARDNGYCFFKYMREKYRKLNCYYVITKNSADYEKVSSLGNIIIYRSIKHYLYFIAAKYKISTHVYGYTTYSDFYYKIEKYLPFYGKKIFLQHGITKDDLPMLYKENTNLDLFCTASRYEYEFIINNFHYDKGVVVQTGFARFDALHNENFENQILIMPTWRSEISKYSEDKFKKTDYYKNWMEIINNDKLIKKLEDNNITLIFYLHIEFQKYAKLFYSSSENIIIATFEDYDVQDLLLKSKLLVTDYSSVFFDFSYMNKPCLYYQFDLEQYRKNHYKKGYFDYETMGFGDVIYKHDDLISKVNNCIDNNFLLSKKYESRINDFFDLKDMNNCERIMNAISKIGDECEK